MSAGDVAFFAVAHPDDETLGPGVALAEHVAAGFDVHVLVMGRSVTSNVKPILNGLTYSPWWGVMHDPAAEGYAPLTDAEFGQARIDECRRALNCWSSGLGTITLHEGGLADGYTAAEAAAVILSVCDSITPGQILLKGHSWLVDDHADHIAIGTAIKNLAAANPIRFPGPRYYVLPKYWSPADPRLGQVVEHWDYPTDAGIAARAENAYRCYDAWAPPWSYAIGYHSVYASMFKPLIGNPRSMYHA